jgi:gamma-glutamylcyclotransferase (GGCT)/AIG2-like uncharacterized protein YtfP
MIRHLFVYGTLRPGQVRWRFLEPFAVGEGEDDSAIGTLFDTGNGYPAAKFGSGGVVHGRVYELRPDRLDEALALLDEVESVVLDPFHRVAITTTTGRAAWAYEYGGDRSFVAIESGDWAIRA